MKRPGDGLQAADSNSRYDDGEDDCRVFDRDVRRQTGDFYNGIDLCKGTNAKEGDENTKEGEQDSQRLIFLSQTVFDVVHRPAGYFPIFINRAVADSQTAFGVFCRHADEGSHPHPEDGPRPAGMYSRCDADDVACTDRRSQSRAKRFETIDISFPLIFRRKYQFQSPRQTENL